ncbi:hypothetical protein ES5_11046 [Dietzia cinnamea P4]|nr:hypothetical protein ES5_11046 [Dietzia cinnamea P4]
MTDAGPDPEPDTGPDAGPDAEPVVAPDAGPVVAFSLISAIVTDPPRGRIGV